MTGTKKIMISAMAGVILLFGIYNWWGYFRTEGVSRPVAKSVSRETPVSPANATVTTATEAAAGAARQGKKGDGRGSEIEEEPPKRSPLEGAALYNPFYRETPIRQGPHGFGGVPHAVRDERVEPAEDEKLMLDLILMDGGRQLAMVNGRLYAKGDRVGSMDIVRIEPGRVVLEDEFRKTRILSLPSDYGS